MHTGADSGDIALDGIVGAVRGDEDEDEVDAAEVGEHRLSRGHEPRDGPVLDSGQDVGDDQADDRRYHHPRRRSPS